ncbi:hypothetical protein niasHT_008520 [Heterodera trifolii]|uniref:Guanine nucleotide-binding protein-like 3 homolog n=1 Tax=Heterodera trifolii TaxID=157864 RepID=A0ABD2MEN4_9BILA
MAKYCLKKQSKRLTCKKKFKIQRKVREHSRKLKKMSKESERKKKTEKQISVPSKCPFKEEILMEAEQKRTEAKEMEQERKARQKAAKKAGGGVVKKQSKKVVTANALSSIEALAKRVTKDEDNYNANQFLVDSLPEVPGATTENSDTKAGARANAKSVRSFAAEVRRTIENADIVIEVLDARDPLGSRSAQIEQLVLDSGKRLVLLLNKIDLVPRDNLLKWLAHLRRQLPTIAFKASTQQQNQKLGQYQSANLSGTFSAKCIGADLVMKLLANYCRNKNIKTSVRVGIVGFPNVGKSSVINSLKRRKCCQTGAMPGLTRQVQEVELDKHIRLIDSPGVVLAPRGTQLDDVAELSLRNVVRVEGLADPVTPVSAILRRCSVKTLMLHYGIAEFGDCDQFLAHLSRRFGRLKKGGRPDHNAAARQVLTDWNSGKLRYYTEPPEEGKQNGADSAATGGQMDTSQPEFVAQFAKEFDLDALDQDIRVLVDEMPQDVMAVDTLYDAASDSSALQKSAAQCQKSGTVVVVVASTTPAEESEANANKSNNNEMDTATTMVHAAVAPPPLLPDSLSVGDGNVQLNSAIRKAVKRNKKHKHRMAKRADKLAGQLNEQMEF